MRKFLAVFAAVCGFGFLPSGVLPDSSSAKEWRYYGGDSGGTRFSPLQQINRSNVTRLQQAWTYRTGELELGLDHLEARQKPAFECTPLVVDGVLYLTTPSSRVIALEATTGKEIWKFDPQAGRNVGFCSIAGSATGRVRRSTELTPKSEFSTERSTPGCIPWTR